MVASLNMTVTEARQPSPPLSTFVSGGRKLQHFGFYFRVDLQGPGCTEGLPYNRGRRSTEGTLGSSSCRLRQGRASRERTCCTYAGCIIASTPPVGAPHPDS